MDIITDLSARAVSFFTVYQEVCKILKQNDNLNTDQIAENFKFSLEQNLSEAFKDKEIVTRIGELFWKSTTDEPLVSILFEKTVKLFDFYTSNGALEEIDTPYFWRRGFRKILYDDASKRSELIIILEYVPLQIILALSKTEIGAYDQRLYQVWGDGTNRIGADLGNYNKWWDDSLINRRVLAIEYLEDEDKLIEVLTQLNVTLPFESLFNKELDEIENLRSSRFSIQKPDIESNPDPLKRAADMQLRGIAISGGGIRSATFNLGVLQKLAELDQLKDFDYISTVSGGGYIGSWLVSWLKRIGSVKMISDLLNPHKSADPMAEEVRPIRWLRMYSNYLSPNTGIMSADSLTMGLTWLRNTLINQSLLILMLCSVLAAIALGFEVWNLSFLNPIDYSFTILTISSVIIIGVGAVITASGMRVFDRDGAAPGRYKYGASLKLPLFLTIWAAISGFIISSWLQANLTCIKELESYRKNIFLSVSIAAFISMLYLAIRGRYYARTKTFIQKFWMTIWLLISTILASMFGAYLLLFAAKLLSGLNFNIEGDIFLPQKLAFIFGPPLILECFTFCVILRMLMMGILFPDERREWWGRMGAVIHRFILIWVMLTFGALVLPELLSALYSKHAAALPAMFGGWAVIIGRAVSLAFQSKSPSTDNKQSGFSIKEMFIRFAPYLFMLGFLMIGSSVLEGIRQLLNIPEHSEKNQVLTYFILTIILGAASLLLSFRIGVNEFSLHHFYRNRLTRAYLGATRRRTDRERTANNFTGFDNQDDIRMAHFTSDKDYSGPYPIINTAMNATTVSELDRQDRKAESFIFSPLYCGYDFSTTRSAAGTKNGIFQYGYRPTSTYSELEGPTIGTALAVSGAAVNPNMGYHSSAPTAFLLTLFNVRLGRWIGNPRLKHWTRSDPKTGLGYLVYDMVGKSDINSNYVCLSDGGHFDNMGIYELVRRRCSYILLCDAEEDIETTCEGLANAIRRCRIDFGVEIVINLNKLTEKDKDTGFVKEHILKGSIWYPGDHQPSGKIIYIKSSLTGNESVDIRQYYLNNDQFPQQSTGDQFFNEAQFESYRKLGYHSVKNLNQLK
jgi:hypothetical protein